MPNIRLAILRAHHDAAYPQIGDPASIAMMMANPDGTAVLQYWEEVTNRQLTFTGSELMPWVTIPVVDPDLGRSEQIRLAFTATQQATGTDLAQFDGFVVLVHPGVVQLANPQAGQAGQNPTIQTTMTDAGADWTPTGKPACALHWLSRSHTFFCHELGHVLGLNHTWGAPNTGADWDGVAPWSIGNEYGDPVDIMSAEGFGRNDAPGWSITSRPTFSLADPKDWGVTPTLPWLRRRPGMSNAGPSLSRAYLHWAYPDSLPGAAVATLPLPRLNETPTRVRLWAADTGGHPRLVLLRPQPELPEGRGRVYLEYRRPLGWDRGLDIGGTDLARQAVIAHTVSTTAGGTRVWYRGGVPIPAGVDTDLMVAMSQVSFRVVGTGDDWVDLDIDLAFDRRVELSVRRIDDVLAESVVGLQFTPCGDPLRLIERTLQTLTWFRPAATGVGGHGEFDDPVAELAWTVGGVAVTAGMSTVTVAGGYEIGCTIDPLTQELELRSRGGERYDVEVRATVTELGNTPLTATETFDPRGWYRGGHPSDGWLVQQCLQKWAKSTRVNRWDIARLRGLVGVDDVGNPIVDRDRLRGALAGRVDQQAVEALVELIGLEAAMRQAGRLR